MCIQDRKSINVNVNLDIANVDLEINRSDSSEEDAAFTSDRIQNSIKYLSELQSRNKKKTSNQKFKNPFRNNRSNGIMKRDSDKTTSVHEIDTQKSENRLKIANRKGLQTFQKSKNITPINYFDSNRHTLSSDESLKKGVTDKSRQQLATWLKTKRKYVAKQIAETRGEKLSGVVELKDEETTFTKFFVWLSESLPKILDDTEKKIFNISKDSSSNSNSNSTSNNINIATISSSDYTGIVNSVMDEINNLNLLEVFGEGSDYIDTALVTDMISGFFKFHFFDPSTNTLSLEQISLQEDRSSNTDYISSFLSSFGISNIVDSENSSSSNRSSNSGFSSSDNNESDNSDKDVT